jgi:hypothetical protein
LTPFLSASPKYLYPRDQDNPKKPLSDDSSLASSSILRRGHQPNHNSIKPPPCLFGNDTENFLTISNLIMVQFGRSRNNKILLLHENLTEKCSQGFGKLEGDDKK